MRQLFGELERRNVYRVAVTYVVAAFVVLQLADLAAGAFDFPGWFEPMIWVVAGLGFPIALVLAWAFELTPEGVRRTTETDDAERAAEAESTSPEQGRARSRLAMKALVGLGLVGAAVVGGWYLTGGGGESPEVSDNTVAVLPFEVTGSGAEDLQDGMVSLLSTGLDGAGGLRAIADRTVLAAWETAGAGARGASTDEALSVAREVGSEHAVIGSAAALGGELQLTVDVHATRSGERLERVEVRGSPDSVSGLTHELARDVIAVRTTAAIEDYEAAIREDSTFALPYARIGFLGVWHEEARDEAMRRAFELADRLLERLRASRGDDAELLSAEREASIQEFEGLRAWKEGDLERAAELLSRSNESLWFGALWRGDLYRELGELERAEGWYRVWQMPVVAYERLGGLYEEMGRPEDAAAAYRRFIAAWVDADPELQGRVEAARERLEQLDGSGPEPSE